MKKPPKPKNTLPAWECPRCGRTHPITVTTCECGPKYREWTWPKDITPYTPYEPYRPRSPFPDVWCRSRP